MKIRALSATLLALLGAGLARGANDNLGGDSDSRAETVPFDPARWTLVWSDEFDRPGPPDPATWGREEGYLRNNEAQYYTRDRPENARVEDGLLVIEARKDDWDGKPITSASLRTKGLRSFRYGRIAVRARVPGGRGTWPAIWLLGDNVAKAGWPACGEIDIMEYVGFQPDTIHANIHCAAYNHTKNNGKGSKLNVPRPWTGFHEFALEWHEDRMEFFCDDTRYFVYRKERDAPAVWPFDRPHFLILNLAIGGAWGGAKGVDESLLPHRFEIDYVRCYEAKPAP